jgi:hypothetical protein
MAKWIALMCWLSSVALANNVQGEGIVTRGYLGYFRYVYFTYSLDGNREYRKFPLSSVKIKDWVYGTEYWITDTAKPLIITFHLPQWTSYDGQSKPDFRFITVPFLGDAEDFRVERHAVYPNGVVAKTYPTTQEEYSWALKNR